MSYRTEPSSPETVTSRASVLSYDNLPADERSIMSLSRSNSERNAATQALTGGENVVRIYTKSPHYLPLACLAMLMNPFLGIPAAICSLFSWKFRREGNNRTSSKCSKLALWLSIVGIVSSIVIIIFIIVYVMVITPNIIRSIKGLSDTMQQQSPELEPIATTTTT